MRDPRSEDPADILVAWEAAEELLAVVPEGAAKDVLRLVAAGLSTDEIAQRLRIDTSEVTALTNRGCMRVLTAEIARRAREDQD